MKGDSSSISIESVARLLLSGCHWIPFTTPALIAEIQHPGSVDDENDSCPAFASAHTPGEGTFNGQ